MFDGQFFPGQSLQFLGDGAIRNPWHRRALIEILTTMGLTGNLRLCLDAADGTSLPTSSAKWLDRSGNGYDFYRGSSAGGDAAEPAINGTADGRSSSEYLSFDGGDRLDYDTTNETWMNNLHKDGAAFTVLAWFYPGSIAAMRLFGTNAQNLSNIGVTVGITAAGALQIVCTNGSGVTALSQGSGAIGISATAWHLMGLSMNEGSTDLRFFCNGTVNSFTPSYSSPSASNATNTMQIGAAGNNVAPVVTGSRMACFAAWEGVALTNDEMQAIFTATRNRFGV